MWRVVAAAGGWSRQGQAPPRRAKRWSGAVRPLPHAGFEAPARDGHLQTRDAGGIAPDCPVKSRKEKTQLGLQLGGSKEGGWG